AEDKPADAPQQQGAEALQKAFEQYAKPGPQHEELKALVGTWDTEMTLFTPGEPQTSKGTAEFKFLLGGRYLEQTFRGKVAGEDFEGRGWTGYDNAKKKYVSVWIDSMGTGISQSEGQYDNESGQFVEIGETTSSMGTMKIKSVTKPMGDDKLLLTMYWVQDGGKEQKMMEVTYTRKK
ncbi:MAG: DUF1579 domain-containing protein, partial [Planctomycetaceae bacterium]